MKRVYVLLFLIIILLLPASFALAHGKDDVRIFVNREELQLAVPPHFIEQHLTVPMRSFLGALGADVEWDRKTNEITIRRGGKNIVMEIDRSYAEVNGETVKLSVPLYVYKGTTMIPLRFLAEYLGLGVNWNEEEKIVEVQSLDLLYLRRFSETEKEHMPEWLKQWVEDTRENIDIQYRFKENRLYLLGTFGEKTTGGYEVRIAKITRQNGTLIVEVIYKEPSPSLPTIQVITKPYDLVYVDLEAGDIPSKLVYKIRGLRDEKVLPVGTEVLPH